MIVQTIFGEMEQPESHPQAVLTSLYTKSQLEWMKLPVPKKGQSVEHKFECGTCIIRWSDKKSTYNRALYEYWIAYDPAYLAECEGKRIK